jgi:hypothetical protein
MMRCSALAMAELFHLGLCVPPLRARHVVLEMNSPNIATA